tara:strand:- start:261 stop:1106 length:846 start_codon:yes stop_codon:yes gene_type:complete
MILRLAFVFTLLVNFSAPSEAGCLTFLQNLFFKNKEAIAREKLEQFQETLNQKEKEFLAEVTEMRLSGMLTEYRYRATSLKLISWLKSGAGPKEPKDLLRLTKENIEQPEVLKEWLRELYEEAFLDIYINQNQARVLQFEIRNKIPEVVMKEVLLRRLELLGFPKQEPRVLEGFLKESQFSEMLGNKELFIDKAFKGSSHGHYIHLWQLDFMGFLTRKHGLPQSLVAETYSWMGKNKTVKLEDGKLVEPLSDVWYSVFDSREGGFSRPERLNPLIESYMGW